MIIWFVRCQVDGQCSCVAVRGEDIAVAAHIGVRLPIETGLPIGPTRVCRNVVCARRDDGHSCPGLGLRALKAIEVVTLADTAPRVRAAGAGARDAFCVLVAVLATRCALAYAIATVRDALWAVGILRALGRRRGNGRRAVGARGLGTSRLPWLART